MNKIVQPQWLEWTKELQFIAQGGLTYSKDVFDIERFERIREITAEMLSLQSEIPIEKVKNLFCNEEHEKRICQSIKEKKNNEKI